MAPEGIAYEVRKCWSRGNDHGFTTSERALKVSDAWRRERKGRAQILREKSIGDRTGVTGRDVQSLPPRYEQQKFRKKEACLGLIWKWRSWLISRGGFWGISNHCQGEEKIKTK